MLARAPLHALIYLHFHGAPRSISVHTLQAIQAIESMHTLLNHATPWLTQLAKRLPLYQTTAAAP